jgi:glycosyltransferase involved in cell wall biosynthesis
MKFFDALNCEEKPTATVIVNTYNHGNLIEECLNSIIRQNVTFSCELIIFDDHSTDNNKELINSIVPDSKNVRKIFSEENLFSQGKKTPFLINLLGQVKGDVFFLIDGDDFWTCDNGFRIQKMTDELSSNSFLSMCFSDTLKFFEDASEKNHFLLPGPLKTEVSVRNLQLVNYSYINLGAACFRNVKIQFPPEYHLQKNGDTWWPLLWSSFGPAKYIENCGHLSYRQTGSGVWSSLEANQKKINKLVFACQLISYLLRVGDTEAAEFQSGRLVPLIKR